MGTRCTALAALALWSGWTAAQEAQEVRRSGRDLTRIERRELNAESASPLARATVTLLPGVESVKIADPSGALATPSDAPAPAPQASAPTAGWPNFGGTPERNGRSRVHGPSTPDVAWSGGRQSIIAWPPMIMGYRMFTVRQLDFPPPQGTGAPFEAPIVATNLGTGAELWAAHIPYEPGDWTTWLAGARDGRVYASRAGNGASVAAKLYALDAATGAVLWVSADDITTGAYDGVVFAPDGDLILGSFLTLTRINAEDGATVWSVPRLCRVSGDCGAVVNADADAVYIADAAVGFNNVVVRHDLSTGVRRYESPSMPGFTQQDVPFVGFHGRVYFARTQNNAATDFLYSFTDTGTALVQNWSVPSAWMATTSQGVRSDGSVCTLAPGYQLVCRAASTGVVVAAAPPAAFGGGVRMAVDAGDKLYVAENFSSMRAYTSELKELFALSVPNLNVGGPVLGWRGGTLVVTGIGTDVRALRSAGPLAFGID